ncbi:hypothetical protein OQ968_03295 [Mycobacterium sp. 663a-19]|uniref:hypothetical protein n=1 Tax=Mycobacterium sp. 663a-19 TaxID=2986148 RepID=UPI002D1E7C08|nr:hypothetical protein [Mycobacterium sp. 663a-19]MEB3980285.1 hypothetical protein [Mycobacterium sp. 663a-19]
MITHSGHDPHGANTVFGTELGSGVQESTDGFDSDAYEHEQWLRENVPPHHS